MTTASYLLNKIAAALNTTNKTVVINTAVAMLVKQGLPVQKAIDLIMGEGAYREIVGQVYEALRAKAAA